ncbi:MAG: exo-beta-N-acetylmuramidase NamZ domain-containing protein [Candidatus Neomarinimicrobiota bacterium]
MKRLLLLIKSFLIVFGIFLIQSSCWISSTVSNDMDTNNLTFKTGLDVLKEDDCLLLKGKRVALITNQTGLDSDLIQNIDIFIESENVNLRKIFTPEHGIFGSVSAGKKILSGSDSIYSVPIFSLYGENKKPSKSMLKDLDILVFDIQDVGIRSYTYISTMGLAMQSAAENGLEFLVIDRPNPLGLRKIEGNLLDVQFSSFIGQYPIPYVYGLTCGELAMMINEEGWLGIERCNLSVVKMKNYGRDYTYKDLGVMWIPTSPHVPSFNTPIYMVATGILGELGVFSNGVGYTTPFMTIAAPWIDAFEMANRMNLLNLKGVLFRPVNYRPYYAIYKGEEVGGVQIHVADIESADLIAIQFYFLQQHYELYPNKNPFEIATDQQLAMFDKALGTDIIRKNFIKNFKVDDIYDNLVFGLNDFKIISAQYHLYD